MEKYHTIKNVYSLEICDPDVHHEFKPGTEFLMGHPISLHYCHS